MLVKAIALRADLPFKAPTKKLKLEKHKLFAIAVYKVGLPFATLSKC